MPPRDWRLRIEDILDAAARAHRYVADMDLAAFVADDRTLDAVSRCFGIIGEAVTHVPKEVIAAHPDPSRFPHHDAKETARQLAFLELLDRQERSS